MSCDVTDNLPSLVTIFPHAHLLSVPVISRSARFTNVLAPFDTNRGLDRLLLLIFCHFLLFSDDLSIGVPAEHESLLNFIV